MATDEGVLILEGAPDSKKVLYGNLLWDGALSLSRLLCQMASNQSCKLQSFTCIKGKRILELGAGTGVVGLTCARYGATHVALTDNEPELLELMDKNIKANSLSESVCARLLDWNDKSTYLTDPFDCVVAADVLYAGDGSSFCQALLAHLSTTRPMEAFVANHHNPDRCGATLGFIKMAIENNLHVERLEDACGFALGSIHCFAESGPFCGASFVHLGTDLHVASDKVQNAKFRSGNLKHFENIQIFRLTRGKFFPFGRL